MFRLALWRLVCIDDRREHRYPLSIAPPGVPRLWQYPEIASTDVLKMKTLVDANPCSGLRTIQLRAQWMENGAPSSPLLTNIPMLVI